MGGTTTQAWQNAGHTYAVRYTRTTATCWTFVFLTDNAARGQNIGLETQVGWRPVEALRLSTSLGLLRAQYKGYQLAGVSLDGRDEPHAPHYQFSLSAEYRFGGGFYTQPFYPKEIATWSEEQVFQALMKQAQTEPIGVWGEIGSWDWITKDERKVFRAVGRAAVATNMPIFTHTGIPGKSALEQLDIFEDVGVDPKQVVIGHVGNLVDANVEVHRAICRRGAFIGFDRQGGGKSDPGQDVEHGSSPSTSRAPPRLTDRGRPPT